MIGAHHLVTCRVDNVLASDSFHIPMGMDPPQLQPIYKLGWNCQTRLQILHIGLEDWAEYVDPARLVIDSEISVGWVWMD